METLSYGAGNLLRLAVALGMTVFCQAAGLCTEFDAYNPDKTGQTDVSDIIQKALADTAASDKILIFSPGKYWVAKPVTTHGNGVTICSRIPVSAAAVILQGYKAGITNKVVLQGPAAPEKIEAIIIVKKPSYNLTVAGITFDYAVTGLKGGAAIAASKIENCAFINCDYGIQADPIQIVTISDCDFSSGKYGIRGRDPEGPRRNRSNLVMINNCVFRKFSEYAIQLEGSPINIRECDFENNAGGAVELLDIYVSNITGCYLEGNADKDHPLIRVSPFQLPERHNGQLNVYGNQINANEGNSLIFVAKGSKLHAYDNFVSVQKEQFFVNAGEDTPDPNIKIDDNYIIKKP